MVDAAELRIVSSNNVEILRHLGEAQLRRARLVHTVADGMAELRERIATENPALVIVDAQLADGSGYDLCREIKSDKTRSGTQVIVVHTGVPNADEVAASAGSGCNDVMALPLPADDFYCHLAQVSGVSWRDSLRVGVDMTVKLERDDVVVQGDVVNLGLRGLGIRVADELAAGPIDLTIEHSEGTFHGISAEVVWCKAASQEGFAVGLRLLEVPALARGLLTRLSLFQVAKNEDGDGITVAMQGVFDEQTDFRPLLARLEGEGFVNFTMQGVSYLSSSGVSAWCLFLSELRHELGYSFRNCSVAFASQAAMVPMTIGRGAVLSVQAPYACERCAREETRLVESSMVRQGDGPLVPPTVHCHICNQALTFDDLPERYFAFLMD